jgi:hypothetical protein
VDFTYIFKDYTLFEVIHSSFSMYILTTNESLFLELCKYWFSPKFKAKSEKKRMNRENDPKHKYIQVFIVHHRGPDPSNLNQLCSQSATDALVSCHHFSMLCTVVLSLTCSSVIFARKNMTKKL